MKGQEPLQLRTVTERGWRARVKVFTTPIQSGAGMLPLILETPYVVSYRDFNHSKLCICPILS